MRHKSVIKLVYASLMALCCVASSAQNSATVDNLSTNQQGTNYNNSNNTSNTQSTTYNGNAPNSTPPPSAISPSFMAGGNDSCLIGYGGSVSSAVIGISGGSYMRDEQCELLKLSRLLNDFGLKVAAVATLCQDKRVFQGMAMAGTPCPYLGSIGKQATILWQQNPKRRPDYALFSELQPISLGSVGSHDDSRSLSDQYRFSKRAKLNATTADSSDKPADSK